MAVMNKTLIIHHINDIDNIPAMERWFVHHHCPEVMAQEPWLTRYVMYRVMPPAKGMETMGFFNYRVHENLGLDVEGRRSLRGLLWSDNESCWQNIHPFCIHDVLSEGRFPRRGRRLVLKSFCTGGMQIAGTASFLFTQSI